MDLKFYFCESCGKRLTNIDLEEGQAKDKKLKGVYCKSCSVGILTMDMPALTNQEAQRALSAATPPIPPTIESSSPQQKSQPRSSERRITIRRSEAGTNATIGVGIAVVAVLIVVIAVFASARRRAPEQTVAVAKSNPPIPAAQPTPAPSTAPAAPSSEPAMEHESVQAEPPKPDAPVVANPVVAPSEPAAPAPVTPEPEPVSKPAEPVVADDTDTERTAKTAPASSPTPVLANAADAKPPKAAEPNSKPPVAAASNFKIALKKYEGKAAKPTIEAAGTPQSFCIGAKRLSDREFTWKKVPPELDGQTHLLTAAADRGATKYVISVSAPCWIYAAIEPRHENRPLAWMDNTWQDSGLTCHESSLRSEWKLWKKEIPAAGDVTLGYDDVKSAGVDFIFVPKTKAP